MDYKPNSNRFKEEQKQKVTEEKKRPGKVTSGKVVKKSGVAKLAGYILPDSIENIGQDVLVKIIIPTVCDGLSTILKQTVDAVFGRGTSAKISSVASKTQYRKYYDGGSNRDRFADSREPFRTYDYDEIVIPSLTEAFEVVDRLIEMIARYGRATVGDYYDTVGVTGTSTDENYGWRDINYDNTRIAIVGDSQYVIQFPRIEPLK